MSKVHFYYFNFKGLGESQRLLLLYAGGDFVDHRLEPDEWAKLKSSTPFGQIPMLVINGKQYAQSIAICRYLGNKYGLTGDNAEEAFEIDQNVDFLYDLRAKAAAVYYEANPESKAKKLEDLLKILPDLLEKLNEIIVKNNGHIAAGKLTWGDFVFAGIFDSFNKIPQIAELFSKYPSFKQIVDTIDSIPKVKEFAYVVPISPHGF